MISFFAWLTLKKFFKNTDNLFPKQKETHRHRKQTMVTKGERRVK